MQDPIGNQKVIATPDSEQASSIPKPADATQGVANPPLTGATQNSATHPGSGGNRTLSYFKGYLVPIIGVFLAIIGISTGTMLVTQRSGQKLETSGASTNPSSPHLTEIVARGTIRIGTDATYPPMEYLENGILVGYDIDLGERIADKLNLKAEFINIPWDDLFTSLDSSQVDIVISSVTITDERKEKYDFSEGYLNAGQVIVTKKENTTIKKPEDLSGLKVAVQSETTNETEALKYTSSELVLQYRNFLEAADALKKGSADALITDLPNAKVTIDTNPELKIASEPFTQEFYGIMYKKGDVAVKVTVDGALKTIRQQGTPDYLKHKWLE